MTMSEEIEKEKVVVETSGVWGRRSPLSSLVSAVVVFIFSLLFFSDGLDNRPFFTRGEGREALVVRDMLSHSNMVLPFDDRSDIPTKPPMFHWMGVIVSHLLPGKLAEEDIRSPSAICGALGLAAMVFVTSRIFGVGNGLLLGAILGTSSEWSRSAGHARVDMCFCLFLTLSLLGLYRIASAHRFGDKAPLVSWLLVTFSSAAAVLSKGPAGLVIPWAIAVLYLFISHFLQRIPLRIAQLIVPTLLSVISTILIAGSWYFLAYEQGGDAFIKVHLFKENIGRFTLIDGADQGHVKPVYYGILYLLIGFSPWSFFLPLACGWLWENRKTLKEPGREFLLFSLVWIGVVLTIVSISQSKRDVYLLPAFPALAYFVTFVLRDLKEKARNARRTEMICGISIAILAGIFLMATAGGVYLSASNNFPLWLVAKLKGKSSEIVQSLLAHWEATPTLLIPLALATLSMFIAAWASLKGRRNIFLGMVAASSLLVTIIVNHLVFPAIADVESPKGFMEEVSKVVGQKDPLYQFQIQFFSAMYYADRRVTMVYSLEKFEEPEEAFILAREDQVDEVLRDAEGSKIVLESNNYAANGQGRLVLIRNSAEPDAD